jgi:acetate kinase
MSYILVINSGSSSLKYKLFRLPEEAVHASGRMENIGDDEKPARLIHKRDDRREVRSDAPCAHHLDAVRHVLATLFSPSTGPPVDPSELAAVGHRVVHGGQRFSGPTMITEEVLAVFSELSELAPLHMPINMQCIEGSMEAVPEIPQFACFDTAFFQDMPETSYLYPVPKYWHDQYAVRRYGFHGISYEYVTAAAAETLGKPLTELKLIAAHLGNGSSIMSFEKGCARDTSMGFTPLEGLMMGTRSGNFDPAIFPHIMAHTGLSVEEILEVLNTKSGLLGISGISRDMREIIAARENGDQNAALAFDMFVHILRKYVGAYFFCLGGADAVVFTGGIGENAPEIRQAVFEPLGFLGLRIDPEKNACAAGGRAGIISTVDASVPIMVLPADEERMIARSVSRNLSCEEHATEPAPGRAHPKRK